MVTLQAVEEVGRLYSVYILKLYVSLLTWKEDRQRKHERQNSITALTRLTTLERWNKLLDPDPVHLQVSPNVLLTAQQEENYLAP